MTQYARPNVDISTGAWTPSTGASLFECINEVFYDEADYIQNTGTSSTCEVDLTTVLDPTVHTGHTVNIRAKRTATGSSCTCYVIQGTTVIASFAVTVTSTFQTTSYTLTAAEAGAITNYADLRLRFTGVKSIIACGEITFPDSYKDFTGTAALSSSTPAADINRYGNFTGTAALASATPDTDASRFGNFTGTAALDSATPNADLGKYGNFTGTATLQSATPDTDLSLAVNFTGTAAMQTDTPNADLNRFGNFTGIASLQSDTPDTDLNRYGNFAGTAALASDAPDTDLDMVLGGVTAAGYRSLMAFWLGGMGGLARGPAFRSLFAFWMGGGGVSTGGAISDYIWIRRRRRF